MSRFPTAPVFGVNNGSYPNQKNGIVSLVNVFDDDFGGFSGAPTNAQIPIDDNNDFDNDAFDSSDDSDDPRMNKKARGSRSMTEEQKVERR